MCPTDDNELGSFELNSDESSIPGYRSSHGRSARSGASPVLHKLRVLRLSGNRLTELDVSPFPNIRTLYIDSNRLAEQRGEDDTITEHSRSRLVGLQRLTKLDNFSARHQRAEGGREARLCALLPFINFR